MTDGWQPYPETKPSQGDHYPPFTDSEYVLAWDGRRVLQACLREHEDSTFYPRWVLVGPDGYYLDGVTHWHPLPKPPA